MTTIQGQITSCASSISQAAGLAALAVSDKDMQVSFDVMRKKVGVEKKEIKRPVPRCGLRYGGVLVARSWRGRSSVPTRSEDVAETSTAVVPSPCYNLEG